jgi:hypothetical protein
MKKTIKSSKKTKLTTFKKLLPGEFFVFEDDIDTPIEDNIDTSNCCLKSKGDEFVYLETGQTDKVVDKEEPVYRLKTKIIFSFPDIPVEDEECCCCEDCDSDCCDSDDDCTCDCDCEKE